MADGLRGKYCIAGVGETEFSRGSGRTTRAMGAEAIRNAMNDAGLNPADVDGMLSYHGGDSTPSTVDHVRPGHEAQFLDYLKEQASKNPRWNIL